MHLFDRFRQGEMRLSRVGAFSDGVFAIVVTLLELKVPPLKDHASVDQRAPRPTRGLSNSRSTLLLLRAARSARCNHDWAIVSQKGLSRSSGAVVAIRRQSSALAR
jgi:hypothetical protein